MNVVTDRAEPRATIRRLWSERYPSANMLFCGGSVIRGEGLPSSDLDVVVVFPDLANAWRESFHFDGWPIDVFAHDPGTLAYFVAQDCASGRPSLAQMIAESFVVPFETPTSLAIQAWARSIVAAPPAKPDAPSLEYDRFCLTDIVHDLQDNRSPAELRALACKLYPLLCNFVLRTRGSWLGSGKTLPKLVATVAPDLSHAIESAFDVFFTTGERTDILRITKQVLAPFGGELFAGFRSDAPRSARVSASQVPWRHEYD